MWMFCTAIILPVDDLMFVRGCVLPVSVEVIGFRFLGGTENFHCNTTERLLQPRFLLTRSCCKGVLQRQETPK